MIHSIHTTFQQFHKCIPLAVAREEQWHIELTPAETDDTDNHLICLIMNLLWPVSKGVPWQWHWPTGKSSLCRFKAINHLLYPPDGSDQVGRVSTWHGSISLEANTRSTKNISVHNQSRGGCYRPALNWSYKDHRVPYLVPRTSHYLPLLWTDVDHWPHAFEVFSFTGKSGWLLRTQLTLWNPCLGRFPRLS